MDLTSQKTKAEAFAALHRKGDPVKLFNIWDAASAQRVTKAGATALATSSFAVAIAQGATDGEKLPREKLLETVAEITSVVDLPLTVDAETGYGATPEAVADTIAKVLAAGGIGVNLEDSLVSGEGLAAIDVQSARIASARSSADKVGIPLFINARCDVFKSVALDQQSDDHLSEVLARAEAYAKAGASGLFVPWLMAPALIEKLCAATHLPVNILASPAAPSAEALGKLGVSRISLGAWPMFDMLARLEATAKDYFATGIAKSG